MPSAKKRITVLFPKGIGLASKFGKGPRPKFVRFSNGPLKEGALLLQLTLKHLRMIQQISRETSSPLPELFKDARSQYDELLEELKRLRQVTDSTSLFNILKHVEIWQEGQALLAAGSELLITVQETSDTMVRAQLSSVSLLEQTEEGDTSPNEQVHGFVFDGDDDEIASFVTAYTSQQTDDQISYDPTTSEESSIPTDTSVPTPEESLLSLASESTTDTLDGTRSTSPTVIMNVNYNFHGSLYSPNSNILGPTSHYGGLQNSGSVIHAAGPLYPPGDTSATP